MSTSTHRLETPIDGRRLLALLVTLMLAWTWRVAVAQADGNELTAPAAIHEPLRQQVGLLLATPPDQFERRIEIATAALAMLREHPQVDAEFIVRSELGATLIDRERFDEALTQLSMANDVARAIGDETLLLQSLANTAVAAQFIGRLDRAIADGSEALRLARALDRPDIAWQVANILGSAHERRGDGDEAIRLYTEALAIAESNGDRAGRAMLLNNIGVVYMSVGELDRAMALLERARAIQMEDHDLAAVASILASMGDVRQMQGDHGEARDLHLEARALRREHCAESEVALSDARLGDVYLAMGEHELALEHLERALAVQRRLQLGPETIATLSTLSRTYSELERPDRAHEAAEKGLSLATDLRTRGLRLTALRALAAAHEAAGDHAAALATTREAMSLERELRSFETRQLLAEFDTQLDTREQERELDLLRSTAELQSLAMRKDRLFRNLLLVVGVSSLLIAIAGWGLLLMRRRTHRAHRESEERLRQIADNVGEAFFLSDAATDKFIYVSPGFEQIWGIPAERLYDDCRAWQKVILPADAERVRATLDAHDRGRCQFSHEYRIVRPDGAIRWVHDRVFPVCDANGRVHRVVGVAEDVTNRKRADAAIRETEERLRLVTQATRDSIYDWNSETGAVWRNDQYRIAYGASEVMQADSLWWEDRLHPDDRRRIIGSLDRALGGGDDRWAAEYRFLRVDGAYAYIVDRGFIVRDTDGRPTRIIGAMTDMSDVRRGELVMKAIAEGTATVVGSDFFPSLARAIAQTLDVRFVMIAEHTGVDSISIRPLAACSDDQILQGLQVAPASLPEASVLLGRPTHVADDVVAIHPGLADLVDWMPVSYCSLPMHDAEGNVMGHLAILDDEPMPRDLTELPVLRIFTSRAATELERQRIETRQQLMMRELDHRVKNNLAMILSLAEQTSVGAETIEDFLPAFSGRIQSMAIVHEMLAKTNWDGVELTTMASRVIEPYRREHARRVTISGGSMRLPTSVAPPLCMVLHELATNAAKYGALSMTAGHVSLEWTSVIDDEGRPVLRMHWQESDGPTVAAPSRAGFGTALIEGLIVRQLRGEIRMDYLPEGLVCELSVPIQGAARTATDRAVEYSR